MNRLLYFIFRYQTGLLFTVLLFIGFALFAFGADYHRAWYFNRLGKATFRLHAFRENVLMPGKYARENRALIEENAEHWRRENAADERTEGQEISGNKNIGSIQ